MGKYFGGAGGTRDSNILKTGYVYYKRLIDDAVELEKKNNPALAASYRNLYNAINNRLNTICQEKKMSTSLKIAQSSIRGFAAAEYGKEQAWLSERLGYPISWDYTKKEDCQKIIVALTLLASKKEEFARNWSLIEEAYKNPQKENIAEITKFLLRRNGTGYVQKALENNYNGEYRQKIITSCSKFIIGNTKSTKGITTVFKNWIMKSIKDGLIEAFNSEVSNKKDFEEKSDVKEAYSQLISSLENVSEDANEIVQRFFTALEMPALIRYLEEAVINMTKNNTEDLSSLFNETVNNKSLLQLAITKTSGNAGQKTGSAREALIATLLEYFAKNPVISNSDGSIQIEWTGKANAKADVLELFGFDTTIDLEKIYVKVDQKFKKSKKDKDTEGKDRQKFWERAKEIKKHLDQFEKGFLVEENVKNYYMNAKDTHKNKKGEDIETFGFSAGAYHGAEGLNFLSRIHQAVDYDKGVSAEQLFNTIINLGDGTVGGVESGRKEQLESYFEQLLAQDIGHALFDDHEDLGEEIKQNSSNSIHILNLNGFRIFLSFLYYLLDKAISETLEEMENIFSGNKIKEIVAVDISPSPIISKYGSQDLKDFANKGDRLFSPEWEEQSEYSRKNTKIQMHFLHSFTSLIHDYLDGFNLEEYM